MVIVRGVSRGVSRGASFSVLGNGGSLFNPLTLFQAGEQGAWYDPSDITTLFQDSAGTIPVTTSGHPVGLMLDKSRGYGPEELTNGDFSSGTGWNVSATSPATATISAGVFSFNSPAGQAASASQNTLAAGKTYYITLSITAVTGAGLRVQATSGAGSTFVDFTTTGEKRLLLTAGGTGGFFFLTHPASGAASATVDSVSVKEVIGLNLTQTVAGSRPTYRDVGGLQYLEFDGTADHLFTPSQLSMTASDELSVFAGIRKTTDAATGIITELSGDTNLNNGSFYLATSIAPPNGVEHFAVRGGVVGGRGFGVKAAPATTVLTGLADISGDTITTRRDGVLNGTTTSDLGAGNFGSYTLWVGARTGSALRFTGNLYGLIIRGKTSSATEVSSAEQFLGIKSGISIP